MNILTLNILVDNVEEFASENEKELNRIRSVKNLAVNIEPVQNSKFDAFIKTLERTNSEYVAFYDDENVLNYKEMEYLADKLSTCEAPVISQRLSFENIRDKDFFLTGAMRKNNLYFNRYIFKTDVLKAIGLSQADKYFYEEKIILELTKDTEDILLFGHTNLETNAAMELNVNLYTKQFMYEWYIPFFEDFLLPYVQENNLTKTQQRYIVYFIMLRFYLNTNERNKHVLENEQVDRFFDLVRKVLQFIDDEYLYEIKSRGMVHQYFAYLMLKEKHQEVNTEIVPAGKQLFYYINGVEYGEKVVKARIALIEYKEKKLIIEGEIVGDYFLKGVENSLKIYVNKKEVPFVKTERYNLSQAFGRSIYRYYLFKCEIKRSELEKKSKIQFKIATTGGWVKIPLEFDKVSSRLVRSHWSYYLFDNKMITFSDENLIVTDAKPTKTALFETAMMLKTIKNDKNKKRAFKNVGLKLLYWITRSHYTKKPIWIFYDKLYKAGDNAEYLFRYCMENHPEADCYYILNKTANEYHDLRKKYGKHIVVFDSVRDKLAVLNAKIIFATHATVWGFCGFNATLRRQFKHLLNADVVCIQHGLTIQNIAQYQNKLKDNTQRYFCASKYEINNLKRPIYGYKEEDLCLTGSPRYDGLVNNDQKQVLIAPTWRRNIVITGNKMGTAKEYNPEFKHTKYFEIYNRLINDRRLLETAKKHGYKIVFLIHPTLSSQVDDYDTNEYLSIIPAVSDVSYEKMLTESSVMLTDYSGIQFDFAYMKKPVLYYQPKELPPQYTEGFYHYDTMGFGPIIEEYDEIVEMLCQYIENGCKMEEAYQKRVDDFFEFTDHSNCRRIMDEIMKWRSKTDKK